MHFIRFILQDWKANRGNTKGRAVLLLFRLANRATCSRLYYFAALPYLAFYKFFVEWTLGIGLPWNVKIGKNCRIFHGHALVISSDAVIGDNCTLRHCTTIGNRQLANGNMSNCPVIGNHVDIGSNVCIIGGISIGEFVKIGCGSVVVKNIAAYQTAVGNPATAIVKKNKFILTSVNN